MIEGSAEDSGADDVPGGEDTASRRRESEISLVRIGGLLLQYRRPLVAVPVATAVLVVIMALLGRPTYTASAAFMPQGEEARASGLSGIAAQFGVSVSTAGQGESAAFYADLLRSRELLRAAVETTYPMGDTVRASTGDSIPRNGDTLVEILDVPGRTRDVRVANAAAKLGDMVSIGIRHQTGLVDLSVTTGSPRLSDLVARRLIELVNQFNLQTRQTEASAEREFLAERVEKAKQDLLAAEDSLEQFLERNRSYQNSPTLRFEYERLQRRVSLQQQVYTSLAQSYEQAKIDEVRNTPVITVVEPSAEPLRPDPRRLRLKAVLALILGGGLVLLWIVARESVSRAKREDPEDFGELRRLWTDTKDDVKRTWRRVRRLGTFSNS